MATKKIAKFVGFSGTERHLTRQDQNDIVGTSGVGKKELVWPVGNGKLDVTDVHEDVLAWLEESPDFEVKDVEVDEDEDAVGDRKDPQVQNPAIDADGNPVLEGRNQAEGTQGSRSPSAAARGGSGTRGAGSSTTGDGPAGGSTSGRGAGTAR